MRACYVWEPWNLDADHQDKDRKAVVVAGSSSPMVPLTFIVNFYIFGRWVGYQARALYAAVTPSFRFAAFVRHFMTEIYSEFRHLADARENLKGYA